MVKRYIFMAMLILVSIAFLSGAFFGAVFLASDEALYGMIDQSELLIDAFYVEQLFLDSFKQDRCDVVESRIEYLSRELYMIGQQIDESQRNYAFIKTRYHTLQMRLYILIHQVQESCEISEQVILYYYARDEEASRMQGEVLDELFREYPVRIFAIEKGYVEELSFAEQFYGIDSTPSLVIDYSHVVAGFVPYDELKEIIYG